MSPHERERLEQDFTFARIAELALDPVRGKFDSAHLREIHRRIFQDLPGAGAIEVTPGIYRPAVEEGLDWMKGRGLSTVPGPFFVAYSNMGDKAKSQLDETLAGIDVAKLAALKPAEFTDKIAGLYAQLDYLHPFGDGNSRTLREFTKQLAREAGYDLPWERFGVDQVSRDRLYIARDISVNTLATPHIRNPTSLLRVVHTMDRVSSQKNLAQLLEGTIRPLHAVAFEKLPRDEALSRFPELREAFALLDQAKAFFEKRIPVDEATRHAAIQNVRSQVLRRLNAGHTSDLARGRESDGPQRVAKEPVALQIGPARGCVRVR